jgi:hypothetical protein
MYSDTKIVFYCLPHAYPNVFWSSFYKATTSNNINRSSIYFIIWVMPNQSSYPCQYSKRKKYHSSVSIRYFYQMRKKKPIKTSPKPFTHQNYVRLFWCLHYLSFIPTRNTMFLVFIAHVSGFHRTSLVTSSLFPYWRCIYITFVRSFSHTSLLLGNFFYSCIQTV